MQLHLFEIVHEKVLALSHRFMRKFLLYFLELPPILLEVLDIVQLFLLAPRALFVLLFLLFLFGTFVVVAAL